MLLNETCSFRNTTSSCSSLFVWPGLPPLHIGPNWQLSDFSWSCPWIFFFCFFFLLWIAFSIFFWWWQMCEKQVGKIMYSRRKRERGKGRGRKESEYCTSATWVSITSRARLEQGLKSLCNTTLSVSLSQKTWRGQLERLHKVEVVDKRILLKRIWIIKNIYIYNSLQGISEIYALNCICSRFALQLAMHVVH